VGGAYRRHQAVYSALPARFKRRPCCLPIRHHGAP